MSLILRNPHSVLATLLERPKDVSQIVIPPHALSEGWDKVAKVARERNVPILTSLRGERSPSPEKGGRKPEKRSSQARGSGQNASPHEGGRTSHAEAWVKDRTPLSAEEIFSQAPRRAGGKGLWLALDCLQDPHNLGAIFRVAAFFKVEGILLTQERSASLTSTVYDVASGGVEYVPFALQTNLQRGFEVAKEAGLWILGASEHAKDSIETITRDRPWLLVLGNEEKGMRRLTEESCDLLCKVAGEGKVTSLNVSVAAGILVSSLAPRK